MMKIVLSYAWEVIKGILIAASWIVGALLFFASLLAFSSFYADQTTGWAPGSNNIWGMIVSGVIALVLFIILLVKMNE